MAATITLPFWPTSSESLSWSYDNSIAVAGGEYFAILSPRLESRSNTSRSSWESTLVPANAFTASEIPLQDPLDFQNFFVGEELTQRHVHNLAWSPPGLAKYKRCSLGVLSTNHILSIWDCDGRPQIREAWGRKLIVNHVLRKFYAHRRAEAGADSAPNHETITTVQQRIRAFAWCPTKEDDGETYQRVRRCEQVLAVSTWAHHIVFVKVRSPHDLLHPKLAQWQADVIGCIDVKAALEDAGVSTNAPFSVDHLAWLTQEDTSKQQVGRIACIAGGRLAVFRVWQNKHSQKDSDIVFEHDQPLVFLGPCQLCGPLTFTTGENPLLIAFSQDSILAFESREDLKLLQVHSNHHLDDRWDEVTGVAFTTNATGASDVHIVSQLSSANAETACLSLPDLQDNVNHSWQGAIREAKTAFGIDHECGGYVLERTSGITASPFADYVATCASMHPSDTVAYVMLHEQQCIVSITREGQWRENSTTMEGPSVRFLRGASTETLLFHLQYGSQRRNQKYDPNQRLLIDTLVNVFQAAQHPEPSVEQQSAFPVVSGSEAQGQMLRLRRRLFESREFADAQVRWLAQFAFTPESCASPITTKLVLERLQAILDLVEDGSDDGPISQKLVSISAVVKDRLIPNRVNGRSESIPANKQETCDLCGRSIPFESLRWARCVTGHQFVRCALTLLSIQAPGISKHCHVCKLQYLNEFAMPEFRSHELTRAKTNEDARDLTSPDADMSVAQQAMGPNLEASASIARLLFAACDVCAYCKGKYTV